MDRTVAGQVNRSGPQRKEKISKILYSFSNQEINSEKYLGVSEKICFFRDRLRHLKQLWLLTPPTYTEKNW
jgi:hypothetical protein